nr:sulfatase-like hydrolase/transferase [Nocardioides sp. B-3]
MAAQRGVRQVLRLHRRGDQPVHPRTDRRFHPDRAPRTPEEGYHLSEDLVDQAGTWIETVSALEPDRPWFTYLSFGACHDPLHVPESWRGRYRGEFSPRVDRPTRGDPGRAEGSRPRRHGTRCLRRSTRTCRNGRA